jgi:hypothetical protein
LAGLLISPAFLFPQNFEILGMPENYLKSGWTYALVPVIFISFLAIYPQLSLWINRGGNWGGTYFISNYDEAAYSAYTNALINGSPRKTDPFLGLKEAEHESLYSIQLIPAYGIALPARALGLSASTAFIVLGILVAIATALAFFWLIRSVTGDNIAAAAGTVIVLCLGTAAAYEGELRHLISGLVIIDYLPFLRRYQPGFAFPLFILFCGAVWKIISAGERKTALIYSVAAGLLFDVLVFSYFYLWTSAVVIFGLTAALYFLLVREERARILISSVIVTVLAACALVPYFIMLGDRATNIDDVQLLNYTHVPDILSPSVLIGATICLTVMYFWRRGSIQLSQPVIIFVLGGALTPVILLNQQVVTGRSLQPIHYEIFVSNYLVLLAVVILFASLRSDSETNSAAFRKIVIYIALLAAGWGVIEAATSAKRGLQFAEMRDEAAPMIYRANGDARETGRPGVLLTPEIILSDIVPTVSTLRPLWNPHSSSAGGITVAENKRLFYLYLYYSGYTEKDLADALHGQVFEVTAAVFGSERALPELGAASKPISRQEIDAEAQNYRKFVNSFDADNAYSPALDYIVVARDAEPDYSHVDRWYLREPLVQSPNGYVLYRLTRR